ncbi:hypothetical protein J6590_046620 [Homalodisca vitripennis]|nr:hypothetical protein J6590_046620 [Homalodisca vitripennis]
MIDQQQPSHGHELHRRCLYPASLNMHMKVRRIGNPKQVGQSTEKVRPALTRLAFVNAAARRVIDKTSQPRRSPIKGAVTIAVADINGLGETDSLE